MACNDGDHGHSVSPVFGFSGSLLGSEEVLWALENLSDIT